MKTLLKQTVNNSVLPDTVCSLVFNVQFEGSATVQISGRLFEFLDEQLCSHSVNIPAQAGLSLKAGFYGISKLCFVFEQHRNFYMQLTSSRANKLYKPCAKTACLSARDSHYLIPLETKNISLILVVDWN